MPNTPVTARKSKRKQPPHITLAMRDAAIKSTPDLCKTLVRIAAFNLQDNPKATTKIYEVCRTLQILSGIPINSARKEME